MNDVIHVEAVFKDWTEYFQWEMLIPSELKWSIYGNHALKYWTFVDAIDWKFISEDPRFQEFTRIAHIDMLGQDIVFVKLPESAEPIFELDDNMIDRYEHMKKIFGDVSYAMAVGKYGISHVYKIDNIISPNSVRIVDIMPLNDCMDIRKDVHVSEFDRIHKGENVIWLYDNSSVFDAARKYIINKMDDDMEEHPFKMLEKAYQKCYSQMDKKDLLGSNSNQINDDILLYINQVSKQTEELNNAIRSFCLTYKISSAGWRNW